MTDDTADELTEFVAEIAKEYIPAPWGGVASILVTRYGKKPIQYFIPDVVRLDPSDSAGASQADFAVIGMGRCGSHVAVALDRMVSIEPQPQEGSAKAGISNSALSSLLTAFRDPKGERALEFKPVMLVGDTDETTFQDVKGLTTSEGQITAQDQPGFLTLSYEPLATDGVGHNPIVSQFFTRALLICPDSQGSETYGWESAKSFLLNVTSGHNPKNGEGKRPPRLAFYVFSSGGGTGCGAAAEILKAQQYSALSSEGNSITYYCAVAVLPEAEENERKRILNSGRFLVQYLADQYIQLEADSDYHNVPKYLGGLGVTNDTPNAKNGAIGEQKATSFRSWNSVLFVSNEIMNPAAQDGSLQESIEHSNQYIAQQLFNLAGPQISAGRLSSTYTTGLSSKNFEAIRLDSMDLLSSLRGPCACCFAAAELKEATKDSGEPLEWIRQLFIRSVSLPQMRSGIGLIEGISVRPTDETTYSELFGNSKRSLEETLQSASEFKFFTQCASIVFSLTAPQQGEIKQSEIDEIMRLLKILFPNLQETRYSVIYGTTENYTLSIYVEGSVVFAPEIIKSVRNYIFMCWPKARKWTAEEFNNWWDKILSQSAPIEESQIFDEMGSVENLGNEYPGLDNLKQIAETSWRNLSSKFDDVEHQKYLKNAVSFEDFLVGAGELTAAIRFYNYFNQRAKKELLD